MNKIIAYTLIGIGIITGSGIAFAQQDGVQVQGGATVSAQAGTRGEARADSKITVHGVVGQPFILDGTQSQDDGTVKTYTWTQVSGPFKFDMQEGAVQKFTPQVAGTYVFELTVTDSAGVSQTKTTATVEVSSNSTVESQSGADEDASDSTEERVVQHNESDLEFIRRSPSPSSTIGVNAVEVRGWDPKKKEEFLLTVKAAAELRSNQDLEHFAQGVLLQDENIASIAIDEPGVHIAYRMPAKIFGIFQSSLLLRTDVDATGKVKVKFPWYRIFFKTPVDSDEIESEITGKIDTVKTELQAKIDAQARTNESASFEGTGEVIGAVVEVNKSKHDSAMSAIQNIRA